MTTLHTFDALNGAMPVGVLVQGTDGNIYGTTSYGGPNNSGTVFRVSPQGTTTSFAGFPGGLPYAGLTQGTDGNFYGTTYEGDGTVFSLSVGLGPFVETLPTAGKVGSRIVVLGNALTGTTSVTFNGTATTFTVVSPTEIKTTVPTGATSGKVQVTTPHGTLTSNVEFRVK